MNRLKELEEQYAREKEEHERMFAQQREVIPHVHYLSIIAYLPQKLLPKLSHRLGL
jgi:hypothetical protein